MTKVLKRKVRKNKYGGVFVAHPQSLILYVGLFVAIGYGIYRTTIEGKLPYIRRFAALEAMDEGIGIAVETGQKVHFGVPGGIGGSRTPSTLASLAIMGHFASKAAQAGVHTVYTLTSPPVMVIAEGLLRDAYLAEGKIEDFNNPEMVDRRLIIGGEGVYPAFYAGLMQRDIAASIIMSTGKFKLFMGEANRQGGVFGIDLAPHYDKLEWGIATFDYVLMLSENYVAGAAITKDKIQLGSALGSDIVTWVMCALFVIFTIVASILGTPLDTILTG